MLTKHIMGLHGGHRQESAAPNWMNTSMRSSVSQAGSDTLLFVTPKFFYVQSGQPLSWSKGCVVALNHLIYWT